MNCIHHGGVIANQYGIDKQVPTLINLSTQQKGAGYPVDT